MIYLLFFDIDSGSREDWNTLYTPCEAFATAEMRDSRKAVIEKLNPEIDFHERELEFMTMEMLNDTSELVDFCIDEEDDFFDPGDPLGDDS